MRLNPYFIAAPFLVIMGMLLLFTDKMLWGLVFFGVAAATFFVGLSRQHEEDA